MDGLILKEKWADKVLSGNKIWEIRGSDTSKRGVIGIIKSGSGEISGEIFLIDSIPLTEHLWEYGRDFHHVDLSWEELLKIYKTPHAWLFKEGSAISYDTPISYKHPQGAVIWVKDADVFRETCNETELEKD